MNNDSENLKVCPDCTHYAYFEGHRLCKNPEVQEFSVVTGEVETKFCYQERGKYGSCGPDGKYWKERSPRQVAGSYLSWGIFWAIVLSLIVWVSSM